MTRNRIRYVMMVIIFGILCIFYYNNAFLILFVVTLLLPVLSIITAKNSINKIFVDISFEKKLIGKNKKTSVVLKVVNGSFFPTVNLNVGVRIANNFFDDVDEFYVNAAVGIASKRKLEISTSSIYCGNISAVITDVYMYDMLGLKLFEVDYVSGKTANLMILPDSIEINIDYDEVSGGDGDETTKNVVGEDTSEISNIRNYIAGDRLQRIHWKLSTKQDDFMVKEYSNLYDDEIYLLVELEKNNISLLMDTAFSAAYGLLDEQRRFCIVWFNSDINELVIYKVESEEDILEIMRQIYLSKVYSGSIAYINFMEKFGESSVNCIYVSTKRNDGKAKILCEIKNKVVISWVC